MRKTILKMLRMVLVTSALAATAAVPTAAVAEQHLTVQSQVSHFFECLGLLFRDPAKHADLCGPASDVYVDPWPKDNGCATISFTGYIPADVQYGCCGEQASLGEGSDAVLLPVGSCYITSGSIQFPGAPVLLDIACIIGPGSVLLRDLELPLLLA